ncbi:TPA: hypothetical protein ACH3X1_011347 [Trebouxia sp. C0004]
MAGNVHVAAASAQRAHQAAHAAITQLQQQHAANSSQLRQLHTQNESTVTILQKADADATRRGQHAMDEIIESLQEKLKAQHAQHQAAVQKRSEQLESEQQQRQPSSSSPESSITAQRYLHWAELACRTLRVV